MTALASNNRCDQHNVRIDSKYIADYGNSYERHLLCHEFGHAIGLMHNPGLDGASCIIQGHGANSAYDTKDMYHINTNF